MTFKGQDLRLNCWAAVSAQGATSLEIYRENLKGSLYQNIVDKHLPEMIDLYPDGFSFVHDNYSSHTCIHDWMDDHNFRRVPFPTYSPHLSIIENPWSALKDSVAQVRPRNETELENNLKRSWEILTTPENLSAYFENIHSRYLECIEENGGRLPS